MHLHQGMLYYFNTIFLSWKLRFGDVDLSSSADDEDDFVQEVRITKITKHPKYVEGVAYFDIAVLIIEPIEYTGHVRPVCLPSSKDFMVDKYDGVSKVNKYNGYFLQLYEIQWKLLNVMLVLSFG